MLLALAFPPMAMLYLGKGRLALIYFLAPVLVKAAFFALAFTGTAYIDLEFVRDLPGTIVYVIGIFHVVAIAEMLREERPQIWYACWPAVLGIGYLVPTMRPSLFRAIF